MRWNFLKRCWPLPTREARRSRRRKAPPPKPRVRLWRVELEARTVPTTITRTSGSIFSNDPVTSGNQLTAPTSSYVSYQITNTAGVNYADVWATSGDFTGVIGCCGCAITIRLKNRNAFISTTLDYAHDQITHTFRPRCILAPNRLTTHSTAMKNSG